MWLVPSGSKYFAASEWVFQNFVLYVIECLMLWVLFEMLHNCVLRNTKRNHLTPANKLFWNRWNPLINVSWLLFVNTMWKIYSSLMLTTRRRSGVIRNPLPTLNNELLLKNSNWIWSREKCYTVNNTFTNNYQNKTNYYQTY